MLNPAQRAAVEYCDGPLLVLAGAGSGKTRVITEKIAHLVRARHLAAKKIAAITFTNKAAREMRERVGKLVSGEAAGELLVCTFHALGLKFLQIEHERAGLKRGFSVLDADDTGAIIKDLLPKALKSDQLFALRQLVSTAKNNALTPAQALAAARSPREVEAAQLYADYQRRLGAFNAVDFDDLIRLPLALLEDDATLRTAWQERLRYLLVDEYQDTNTAQYRLLKALAGPRGAFTAVGDDDQSIYAWRGANPENLDELARDYPTLKVVKLEQNYRCAARILRAANRVIANNPHKHLKQLWSEHADGPPIRVLECKDGEHEAERVAADLTHIAERAQARWQDFAILYRGNHQSRPLEKALQLARVPYHLSGGTSFLERGEVVGVFPEGRVSHDGLMTRCQHGIGWIAALSGKPIVPTGLKGMFEAMPRTAKFPRRAIVSLHLGAPLSFAAAPVPDPKPEQVHEFSCAVTESIARLLGQESRLDRILPEAPAADLRPLLERVRRKRAKSE